MRAFPCNIRRENHVGAPKQMSRRAPARKTESRKRNGTQRRGARGGLPAGPAPACNTCGAPRGGQQDRSVTTHRDRPSFRASDGCRVPGRNPEEPAQAGSHAIHGFWSGEERHPDSRRLSRVVVVVVVGGGRRRGDTRVDDETRAHAQAVEAVDARVDDLLRLAAVVGVLAAELLLDAQDGTLRITGERPRGRAWHFKKGRVT